MPLNLKSKLPSGVGTGAKGATNEQEDNVKVRVEVTLMTFAGAEEFAAFLPVL